ncbi:ABC transporter permease [Motilibacter aurantiacus]|uniref:ABC transporter permease n=1 Tax=Motilibacter aurantiacus TaxID=2714955 RepID=UPI0014075024|nr:ABC transporter permease [Motilibacter aurantiacus]NHC45762.1 ABC transporter permease [Motilibacter aurantiacus]
MGRYAVRRILQMIPVFFGTTFLIFAMVYATPGDPVQRLSGEKRPDPARAAFLRAEYNLNDPLVVQYGKYMGKLATGDLGKTFNERPVTDLLQQQWPVSVKLTLTGLGIQAILGLGLGLLAGLRRGGVVDKAVLFTTLLFVSFPAFVMAFVLQYFIGVQGRDVFHLPVAGTTQGWPVAYILPGLTTALLGLAYSSRLTRTSIVENLRADYVRTAVAKGLPRRRVVGVHTLRNSLIPVITFLGTEVGTIFGTAIVTEQIFNLNGLGRQIASSARAGEAPVVVGLVTLLVLVYVSATLVVDLLYGVLDPRIRYD